MPVNLPLPIAGTITDSNGDNPSGAKVILRNDSNGEKLSTTTNSSGKYLFDAGNLASGYDVGGYLTVICSFGDEKKESSFQITGEFGNKEVNLTLEVVSESSDLRYAQIQDVLDELDGKTTSDISYSRVRKIILRAEAEIDERTESSFTNVLVTDEYLNFDQYTSWKSAEQLRSHGSDMVTSSRNDYWNTWINDQINLKRWPILDPVTQLNGATTASATTITVDSTADFPESGTIFIYNSTNGTEQINYTGKSSTTFTGCTRAANSTTATAHSDNSYVRMIRLSTNGASVYQADSWTDLEPQSGGGGSFVVYKETGLIGFVNNFPSLGIRSIKASYSYGFKTVPKTVERLTVLLAVKDILSSKTSSSQFDSIDSISLEGISIRKGGAVTTQYFNWLNQEIERLWGIIGEMISRAV